MSSWASRFARNALLWIAPVAVVWVLATPFYNRFLTQSAENLTRLTESPRVTRLQMKNPHYTMVNRTDLPAPRGSLYDVRVTDIHFPLILLGAFFLAVPAIGWRRRLENLGWATLTAIFFHIFLLFFWVKFVYATQLGEWSAETYSPFAQNFWGLGKHVLDLSFKFALPFILWTAFYLRELLPARKGTR